MSNKRCDHCIERLAKAIAKGEGVDIPKATDSQIKHYTHLGGVVFNEIMAIRNEAHE